MLERLLVSDLILLVAEFSVVFYSIAGALVILEPSFLKIELNYVVNPGL